MDRDYENASLNTVSPSNTTNMASEKPSPRVNHAAHTGSKGQSQQAEASAATALEHELTFRDAVRLYPKAIGFSLVFSMAIIMEGYDMALIGSFYGYESYVTSVCNGHHVSNAFLVSETNTAINQHPMAARLFLPIGRRISKSAACAARSSAYISTAGYLMLLDTRKL